MTSSGTRRIYREWCSRGVRGAERPIARTPVAARRRRRVRAPSHSRGVARRFREDEKRGAWCVGSRGGPIFSEIVSATLNARSLRPAVIGNPIEPLIRKKRCRIRGSRCSAPRRAPRVSPGRFRRRFSSHFPQHPPPSTMAAVTFNPLVLSAKASVRGAVVRRAGAKASKRAAFAVKASDDDMDFMVRAARLFFDSHDGARIDGTRRRATRHRGERGGVQNARRAMSRRDASGSTSRAFRPFRLAVRSRSSRRTIRRFANVRDGLAFARVSFFRVPSAVTPARAVRPSVILV